MLPGEIEAPRRQCFRDLIPAIFDVARYLDAAVSAHLAGKSRLAEELFGLANDDELRAWLESIWGKRSPYVVLRTVGPRARTRAAGERMPTASQVHALHSRDGFHCRYCGMPVVRAVVRKFAAANYPSAVPWGRTNASQHAGFQALWAQYDHVVPHVLGGTNDIDNMVVSCAACNFGKMSYRLDEVGLQDPREREPPRSQWDGLERLINAPQLV